jgi:hypothetical protein
MTSHERRERHQQNHYCHERGRLLLPQLHFGADREAAVSVRIWILLFERSGQRAQLRLRPGACDTCAQAPPHDEPALVPPLPHALACRRTFAQNGGHVEKRLDDRIHPGEALRRDAHHGDWSLTYLDGPADDLAIGAEFVDPEMMAENDDGIAAGHLGLIGKEPSTESGLDTQKLKEVATHLHAHAHPRHGVGCF